MKKLLKEAARRCLYIIKRKPYRQKSYTGDEIAAFCKSDDDFTFFGYYDRSPENGPNILMHRLNNGQLDIVIRDQVSGRETVIGHSSAFNLQMGSRAIWKDADTVAWNDFDGEKYVCRLYSLSKQKVVETLPMAVMDFCASDIALGVNFRRLRTVDPNYAYSVLPELSSEDIQDHASDGIWMYNLDKKQMSLLLSLNDILSCKGNLLSTKGKHGVNHITRSPDGSKFMFIHRYRLNGQRFDRLMVYDFKTLRCLLDDPMQSHFCWIDNDNLLGYGTYGGQKGFYKVNVSTGEVESLDELTRLHPKDGHPTIHGDWLIVDDYPALDRMQTLLAYNLKTGQSKKLAEMFHDMKHHDYTRCDLHPRFNADGSCVYFDSIFSGTRHLYYLPIALDTLQS